MHTIIRLFFMLAACCVLVACTDGTAFNATNISGSKLGQGWRIADHMGQPRQMSDFSGKVVMVSFGFTQCPDICPTTLVNQADTMKLLGADSDRVQVLFVTIDPERDTADILKEYVTQFDQRFLGLSGTGDETLAIAKAFNVHFAKVFSKAEGSYTMEHSTGTYLFDKKGNIRLFASMKVAPQALAEDIQRLLAE